jgi:hypothetical protein
MATDYWRKLKNFDRDWVGFSCFLITKQYLFRYLNLSVRFYMYESYNTN